MQIAPKNENSVLMSDQFKSVSFGIKQDGLAHIFGVLRNQLYSDKILAVIREYSANAVDANVEAGKDDQPIIVTAPNAFDPTFRVRDFGNGLNEDEIRDIYANYGESTKRSSNKLIGQLGLGSKSAFAYGDNFVINSYVNGKKSIYNAYIDPSQIGMIAKMNEEETSEPNGVEICVPVKHQDLVNFTIKIKKFFKFWSSKVEVKGIDASEIHLEVPVIEGTNWKFYNRNVNVSDFRSVVVMGNVAYPLNVDLMQGEIHALFHQKFGAHGSLPLTYNFIFYTDIGTLEVSASREDLQYTDYTKKNIIKLLESLFSELVEKINGKIENASDIFEAKRLYQDTFGNLFNYSGFQFLSNKCQWKGFEVNEPDIEFEFAPQDKVDDKFPALFTRHFKGRRSLKNVSFYVTKILPSNSEELIVIDDCDSKYLRRRATEAIINKKSCKGITVIKVNNQQKWQEALVSRGLETYTFKKLSELEAPAVFKQVAVSNNAPATRNKKHFKRSFILDLNKGNISTNTLSEYWTPVLIDLKNDAGVYLHISRFEYASNEDVSPERMIKSINEICSFASIPSVNVFGFKEIPKGIDNNKKLVEFKNWIINTLIDALKAKKELDAFINYIKASSSNFPSERRSLVTFFRRHIGHKNVQNNQEVLNLIKGYKELEDTKNQTKFAPIFDVLKITSCISLFLLAAGDSNSPITIHEDFKKFFEKYPILTIIDDGYLNWRKTDQSDEIILSVIK